MHLATEGVVHLRFVLRTYGETVDQTRPMSPHPLTNFQVLHGAMNGLTDYSYCTSTRVSALTEKPFHAVDPDSKGKSHTIM